MATSASPMIWKMRAANVVIVGVFLVIATQQISTAIEAGLLALGLVCAAYYIRMHRRLQEEKDPSADAS